MAEEEQQLRLAEDVRIGMLNDLTRRYNNVLDEIIKRNEAPGFQKHVVFHIQGFDIVGLSKWNARQALRKILKRNSINAIVTHADLKRWAEELQKPEIDEEE